MILKICGAAMMVLVASVDGEAVAQTIGRRGEKEKKEHGGKIHQNLRGEHLLTMHTYMGKRSQ